MSKSKKRGVRRDRTWRYGARALKTFLRACGPSYSNHSVSCSCPFCDPDRNGPWSYAKGKSMGCRCRRVGRSYGPKIAGSLCHGFSYHPCVRERIRGKAVCRKWSDALASGSDALDLEY